MTEALKRYDKLLDKVKASEDQAQMLVNQELVHDVMSDIRLFRWQEEYLQGMPVEEITSFDNWVAEHAKHIQQCPEDFPPGHQLDSSVIRMMYTMHAKTMAKWEKWLMNDE